MSLQNGVRVINDKESLNVCDMCDKMVKKYYEVTFNNKIIIVCKKRYCKENLWNIDNRIRQILK